MRRTLKATGRRHESGSIAVETAIVLPILILFLGLPSVLYAFYFRQYTAAQKATHDAAVYLSTAPRVEFTTAGPDGNFAALTVAKRIVEKELADIVPAGTSVDPYITCTYLQGGNPKVNACTPQIFKNDNTPLTQFDVAINLPYINPLTGNEVESFYMSIIPVVRYLGN
jgi:Flp pilus assembly protein TadG